MILEIKGIKIETGKPYSWYSKEELSVLPPKDWEGNDLYMVLSTYPDGKLNWAFSTAYED